MRKVLFSEGSDIKDNTNERPLGPSRFGGNQDD